MKATFAIVVFVLVILGILFIFSSKDKNYSRPIIVKDNSIMEIKSSAFTNGDRIPAKYTCDGEDINPELSFSSIPEDARSLALIFDDPDAPAGTWLHWAIWNISSETHILPEGYGLTDETEGITSFGNVGYGGPCPGSGEHRYFFYLFALDTKIDIPSGASREKLEQAMGGHIIEEAKLMGLYSRN